VATTPESIRRKNRWLPPRQPGAAAARFRRFS